MASWCFARVETNRLNIQSYPEYPTQHTSQFNRKIGAIQVSDSDAHAVSGGTAPK